MTGPSASQGAVGTAWLCPSAASLVALAADPPDRSALVRDPAAVAHVLRFARPTPDPQTFALSADVLAQPSLAANAADLLEHRDADPPDGGSAELRRFADVAGAVAFALAADSGLCSPDAAECVARLTLVGWEAVTPESAADCLNDPRHGDDPVATQRRRWGLDAQSIARRLAGRWRLPAWVVGTVGFLRSSVEDAIRVGAAGGVFRVVRAAVRATEERFHPLGLTEPFDDELLHSARELVESVPTFPLPTCPPAPRWLLVRLLRATADARRANGSVWLAESERRVDRLTEALNELRATFDDELRAARLDSIAEFAAGASHEINNPLAVISGHAQLLLTHEADPGRRKQLDAIVRQTRRVHDLLQGSLQFARPPRPHPVPLRVAEWATDVAERHRADAEAKGVRLEAWAAPTPAEVYGDRGQLAQALAHLVRNAIEACPPDGWVRVRGERRGDAWAVCVEDSGVGPRAADVPRLFDPFFSGRSAGRGRGLGLPIAWRLARLNGGDVRFERTTDGPTRFVLTLPLRPAATRPERLSA